MRDTSEFRRSRGGSRRRSRRAIGAAAACIAWSACSAAFAQTDKHCLFEHPQARNGETIVVALTMTNDGKPCVMQRRFKGQPATSLTIREAPANGTLSSTRSEVAYTPHPGFVGKDAFDVEWFGSGFGPNSKSRNIRTKVDVTVRATSDEPDAVGDAPETPGAKPAQ